MNGKRLTGLLLSVVMFTSAITPFSAAMPSIPADAADEPFRDMTTMEIVDDMGIGINLGNTLEASGDWISQYGNVTPSSYETAWGSPVITQQIIQGYADEGFGVLRIPVAWSNMMADDGTYTINPDYMARVKEVVDWSMDTGMYTIVNIHWDGGWLAELPTNHDAVLNRYTTMWTQIADAFKDYNDHLIFESQNEELGWSSIWTQWGGTEENKRISYGYVNEVNQEFVDTIRSSGGYNDKRHLLISGYNTDIKLTCDPLFEMPNDPANRMAVSVHYYTPANFAQLEEDVSWGEAWYTWGTDADYAELEENMKAMKTTFVDKGVPVIIGEYGSVTKNKEPESVHRFLSAVCREACKQDLCPVLWDVTDIHYDRTTCQMKDRLLRDEMMESRDTYTRNMSQNDSCTLQHGYKDPHYNNPISPDFFVADPTAVEYNGRLYVYGTNDHQQYEETSPDAANTYEKIRSLLVFSTADMVNWTYHGDINVGEIAPWIIAAWAPSIVSRVEEDGKTHFYLYFSNSGGGTGVLTSTDPVTGWTDPLGHCLVTPETPGLSNCPNPFDPGALIDDNGVGWLSFGGGDESAMPGKARIVKLGDDMISFASDFKEIPAPYHMEANELNYINGTYVYTYCTNWTARAADDWKYDCEVPGGCDMVYMTTKTPLDPDSWKVMGPCFKQPGTSGFDYSNNHTHMQKFKGKWYMFYHMHMLKHGMGIGGGYRSTGVDEIQVDENNVTLQYLSGTKKGVEPNGYIDPYKEHCGGEVSSTGAIDYDLTDPHLPAVIAKSSGSWTGVRNVRFTDGASAAKKYSQVNIDTLTYNIRVTGIDSPTTITMYASAPDKDRCSGSVYVSEKGNYSITCNMGGVKGLKEIGYFETDNDAKVTFEVDSITVNDKYTLAVAAELTNTRDWASGLANIWGGYKDGQSVYEDLVNALRYVAADGAIEFFASTVASDDNAAEPVKFLANVQGTGTIEVHLDGPDGKLLTTISFDTPGSSQLVESSETVNVGGAHDLYFVYSDQNIRLKSWKFTNETSGKDRVKGDVNADGLFNVADIVLMQKWLLAVPDTHLADWQAGDLCEDGVLNVFDLCMMKRAFLNK